MFLCSKVHNKYVIQILIICVWEKFIHYLSFNFRVKPLLFLGSNINGLSLHIFEIRLVFLKRNCAGWRAHISTVSAFVYFLQRVWIIFFYFDVIFKRFRFFIPFKLVRKYSPSAYPQNVPASSSSMQIFS